MRLSVLLWLPLLVTAYEPGAEWVPGIKKATVVPPLPPTDPEAEIVGPITDPRPIIDGNFPVDQDHEFASFFVNDKPRLPEAYDKELAAAGLSPEQRRYGENPVGGGQVQVYQTPRYPSRLSERRQPAAETPQYQQPQQQPYQQPHWQQQRRQQQRRQEQAEVPPPRPPLPLSFRPAAPKVAQKAPAAGALRSPAPAEVPGTLQLPNGYALKMVPVQKQKQQRVVSHRRINTSSRRVTSRSNVHGTPAQQVQRGQPNENIIFPPSRRSQRHLQRDSRERLESDPAAFSNQLPEGMPEWPDASDPAAIKRYHKQMRERMDRIMERRLAPLPASDRAGPVRENEASGPALVPASGHQPGVLVEHHQRSSDEPYLRESYKVYKLPNGRRTSYSKRTSTSYSSRQVAGRSKRSPGDVRLRRSPRSWLDDASSWLAEGLSSAEKRGREAVASAGDVLETVGDVISDVTSEAGDGLADTASTVYHRSREAAAGLGQILAQAPEVASQAGSDIYRSAGEAYQRAAESQAGRAVSAHVDRVMAEVDADAVSESVSQAAQAVSQTASQLFDSARDTASSSGEFLSSFGGRAYDTATDAGDVLAGPAQSAGVAAEEAGGVAAEEAGDSVAVSQQAAAPPAPSGAAQTADSPAPGPLVENAGTDATAVAAKPRGDQTPSESY